MQVVAVEDRAGLEVQAVAHLVETARTVHRQMVMAELILEVEAAGALRRALRDHGDLQVVLA
jgi:hypothetical protein